MPYDIFGNKINKNDILSLGIGKSSTRTNRDGRRSFTQSQKKEILYQQDSKCAQCRNKLDPRDIEYDKKPWASGGRTKIVNGRALCGSCHNKTTHKTKLKKTETKKTKTKRKSEDILGFGKIKQPKIKLF